MTGSDQDSGAGGREPLRTAEEAWAFFGRAVAEEGPKLVNIAHAELRRRRVISNVSDAEDLVHHALVHLVDRVTHGETPIYPDRGILVQQIRFSARHTAERAARRNTYADAYDREPTGVDPTQRPEAVEDAAVRTAAVEEVLRAREQLTSALRDLAVNGTLNRAGWEALRTVESDGTGPTPARIRKRASRARDVLRPVVATWIDALAPADEQRDRDADELAAILHGTGLLRLAWDELVGPPHGGPRPAAT